MEHPTLYFILGLVVFIIIVFSYATISYWIVTTNSPKINLIKCFIKYKIFRVKRDPKEVERFWIEAKNDKWIGYATGKTKSYFLLDLINKILIEKNSGILELGCNIGRNLRILEKVGFINLLGIELNKEAVIKSKELYKNSCIRIWNGKIEDYFKTYIYPSFDLIFTMAVLEHLPKESEWVFAEIAKNTRYLITIEDEKKITAVNFPRDYKKIFEKLGMKQIYKTDCEGIHKSFNKNFRARIFVVEENRKINIA